MNTFEAIIPELEDAFQSGVGEKRVEILRRVTDLFVERADACAEEHVALFDDGISRLSREIESRARAELFGRLAPLSNAPIGVGIEVQNLPGALQQAERHNCAARVVRFYKVRRTAFEQPAH